MSQVRGQHVTNDESARCGIIESERSEHTVVLSLNILYTVYIVFVTQKLSVKYV